MRCDALVAAKVLSRVLSGVVVFLTCCRAGQRHAAVLFYAHMTRDPTPIALAPRSIAIICWADLGLFFLFTLSMRGRIDTLPHGTWTDHPPPPSFPRLSKKVRRAVAAMSRAIARVRFALLCACPPQPHRPRHH